MSKVGGGKKDVTEVGAGMGGDCLGFFGFLPMGISVRFHSLDLREMTPHPDELGHSKVQKLA